MAKVEGLVRENHGAESLLPGRNLRTTHPQCTRAHDGPEHGVVLADVRVRPAERRGPILVPLRVTGSGSLPLRVSKRARPRSARSEPRMQLRSVRARVRPRVRAESGRLTNRASGGCARNDDEASNQTAVKRGKYIGQTGRETAPIRRTKAYHCPTKGQSHLDSHPRTARSAPGPASTPARRSETTRASRPSPRARERAHRARAADRGALGDAAPKTVNAVLSVYLSRLRRILVDGTGDRLLLTQAAGYVLRVLPEASTPSASRRCCSGVGASWLAVRRIGLL